MLYALVTNANDEWYKQHAADVIFPLNGTGWARLVQMRLHRDHIEKLCTGKREDLLVRIHSHHCHIVCDLRAVQRAIHHWFLHSPGNRIPQVNYSAQESSVERSLRVLSRLGNTPRALIEVEKNWLEKQKTGWAPQSGTYWKEEVLGPWQSKPIAISDLKVFKAVKPKPNTRYVRDFAAVPPHLVLLHLASKAPPRKAAS